MEGSHCRGQKNFRRMVINEWIMFILSDGAVINRQTADLFFIFYCSTFICSSLDLVVLELQLVKISSPHLRSNQGHSYIQSAVS